MSADLFAEFGLNSTSAQSAGVSGQQRTQASSLISDLDTLEDADFGDFTSPDQSTPQPTQQTGRSNGAQRQNNDNVLFDATLETASNAESDYWGDFETAEPSPAPKSAGPARSSNEMTAGIQGPYKDSDTLSRDFDLLESLSIEDKKPPPPPPTTTPTTTTAAAATKTTKTQATKAPSRKGPTPNQRKRNLATPARPPDPPEEDSFGDWGDFIDGPSTQAPTSAKPASSKMSSKPQPAPESAFPGASSKIIEERVPASQVRPTNIPPPSVLLELFPRVMDQLRQQAMQTRKNPQQKEALEAAASSTLIILKTAARVIAGRTLRWKRDAILSQSMRIGPARSGKPGGMKLSTINKNEDIKEQQQAVDVIAMWRDRAALFSSVVQASGKRPVPVVAENIRAITASPGQGALKASHACALCGLKRDERLPKVDEGVEDSFGEWWTDHWGHTDCRDFWGANSKFLDQR